MSATETTKTGDVSLYTSVLARDTGSVRVRGTADGGLGIHIAERVYLSLSVQDWRTLSAAVEAHLEGWER